MAGRDTEERGDKELYVEETWTMDRTFRKSQTRNNDGER
jgi:hypothetical protein